jgi:hypothetical protein
MACFSLASWLAEKVFFCLRWDSIPSLVLLVNLYSRLGRLEVLLLTFANAALSVLPRPQSNSARYPDFSIRVVLLSAGRSFRVDSNTQLVLTVGSMINY